MPLRPGKTLGEKDQASALEHNTHLQSESLAEPTQDARPAGTATDVYLSWCSLDLSAAGLLEAYAVLCEDEIARAARYRFARDRLRFVAARSFLRKTLAQHLSVGPRDLAFIYGPFGKPALSPTLNESVEFNMSHSGGRAILAIACGATLGVDVEEMIHVPAWRGIASRYFSTYENSALSMVPTESQEAAFYRCWTRKEAFLKALGSGLAHPLDSFDVSLDESRAELVAMRGDLAALNGWTLHHLRPAPSYVGALAVKANRVRFFWVPSAAVGRHHCEFDGPARVPRTAVRS
jgi:4'-phosphopantetheinyl transferase